jgi:hypothetical protein
VALPVGEYTGTLRQPIMSSGPSWNGIVSSVVVGAVAITTLAITGSMEHATAIAVLAMFPFKGGVRD